MHLNYAISASLLLQTLIQYTYLVDPVSIMEIMMKFIKLGEKEQCGLWYSLLRN